MHWLQGSQCSHHEVSAPSPSHPICIGVWEKPTFSQNLINAAHIALSVSRKVMSWSLNDNIRPLQIFGYAIWANQCTISLPSFPKWSPQRVYEPAGDCLHWQHPDLLSHRRRRCSTLLTKLLDSQLFIKVGKCEFHYLSVKCLGYMPNERGVSMDKSKVEAVSATSHY